jgi:anti-sigma28 factor (negative regulator of flagellin synthesis)
MTIDRVGPVDPVQNLKKTRGPDKPRKNEGADSIHVSEEARSKAEVYQAAELAKGAPEIRWELVEAVKKRLQDPNYISDQVLKSVAERLMEYFEIT